MSEFRVTWSYAERHITPQNDEISAVGLNVSYEGRETYINIVLPQPVSGRTPEKEFAFAEMTELRRALDHILAGRSD